MANYNKSFNFRNGVQVDTDKFIVNTAGLVGIGSTIPTNYLDVNGGASVTGDIKVTGLVTTSQLYVSGVSTFFSNVGIGTTNPDSAADSNNTTILNAGIVTAVRYYGDGTSLSGVRSIAVNGWDIDSTVGSGIAYTTYSVGIGTTNPQGTLHVYADGSNAEVTAQRKDGASILTQAQASLGRFGTNSNHDLQLMANSSGYLTITTSARVGINSAIPTTTLDVDGTTETKVLRVTGTSLLVGNVDLTNNLTVNGTSTLNGDVEFKGVGGASSITFDQSDGDLEFVDDAKAKFGDGGDLSIYHSGSHSWIEDTGTGNLVLKASRLDIQDTSGNELLIAEGGQYVRLNYGANERLKTSGVGVTITDQIDAGTLNLDQGYLESINSTGISTVSVGQSVGVGKSTGILRFGSATGTLDLINNDDGDLTFGLDGDTTAGINTGDFKWTHRGNNTLMTLSYGGNLGINEETPIHPLHVGGSSTITGAAWFGNNVNVKNNINCDGNITGTFTLQNPITSDVNSTGVSTIGGIHVYGGGAGFNGLGIGTDQFTGSIKLDVTGQALFRGDDGVGINTTAPDAFFPLVVNGDMKVNKITGFAPQGSAETQPDTGVSLQYNRSDRLSTTGAGVTVAGICTASDGFVSDNGSPVKITVSGSTLTFTVGAATTSFELYT